MYSVKKALLFIACCLLITCLCAGLAPAARATDVPRLERIEYLGRELSRDKNNPTALPYVNTVTLVGNSACVAQTVDLQYYLEGFWTHGGIGAVFDKNGEYLTSLDCPIPPYAGFPATLEYNKAIAVKFVYQNHETGAILSEGPTYYVKFLHEWEYPDDLRVAGIFKYTVITSDQLLIELIPGYHFSNGQITVRDGVTGKEFVIQLSDSTPNLTGMYTNKIIYSGFRFQKDQYYDIEVAEGAVISDEVFGPEHEHKYNMKHGFGISVESSADYIKNFLDVDEDSWAYQYIKELTEKNIINGYQDGTFKPGNQVTRSEFAKMLVTALNIPLNKNAGQTFSDVVPASWDFAYVEAAKPYLTGYYDGRDYYFKGNEPAVREDLAVALVKALKLENAQIDITALENIFNDQAAISPNLKSFVLIAYQNKLIGGYPDNTFRPQQPITRAEAAAMISRMLNSGLMEKVTFGY